MNRDVVIAAYRRTPFTPAMKGALKKVRPDELGGQLLKKTMLDLKLDPALIEDIILGCAFPEAEQGFNMGRLIGFVAGFPECVTGMTLNRFCGSSMQSIHIAAGNIQMGAGDAFLCVGVESMSRVPMVGYNPMPHPELYKSMPGAYVGMGETAENVAKKYKVSRTDQEAFAVLSQQKAAKAQQKGKFSDEIVPIDHDGEMIHEDGCLRPETTAEGLATLKPAFDEKGVVTAGTASPLTDGAAVCLVCTAEFAKKHKLKPLAKVKACAVAGCSPEIMGIGPIPATKKVLDRAGLRVEDLDIIELNEAFASQSLAVIRELGLDMDKVNIDGGAIALGHPLGATGARIVGKAAQLLKREKGKYALVTQCIGGGQGIATLLEAI